MGLTVLPDCFSPFEAQITKIGVSVGQDGLLTGLREANLRGEITVLSDPALGIVVVKPSYRNDDLILFVWVAIARIKKAIEVALPLVVDMAHSADAKLIEFRTKRIGFARVARKYGFELTGEQDGFQIYQKEVRL